MPFHLPRVKLMLYLSDSDERREQSAAPVDPDLELQVPYEARQWGFVLVNVSQMVHTRACKRTASGIKPNPMQDVFRDCITMLLRAIFLS